MKAAYHSIMVHLASGPLILAFVVATFRFWFRPRRGVLKAIWDAGDHVVLYAALFGTIMMAVAMVTGFSLRPMEAFLNSPIAKNKIVISTLAMVFWCTWLALRYWAGPRLWDVRGYVGHYAYLLIFAGAMFLVAVNSIGGDIAGRPSGYEQFAMALGFRTRHALYFPTWMNVALWASGGVAILFAIRYRVRSIQDRS